MAENECFWHVTGLKLKCWLVKSGDFNDATKQDLVNLRDNLDRKDVRSVNWKEFVVAFMDKNIAKREENIQKVLRRFSAGTKSHLGFDDVVRLFGGEDAAREIFDYLDTAGDGKILHSKT